MAEILRKVCFEDFTSLMLSIEENLTKINRSVHHKDSRFHCTRINPLCEKSVCKIPQALSFQAQSQKEVVVEADVLGVFREQVSGFQQWQQVFGRITATGSAEPAAVSKSRCRSSSVPNLVGYRKSPVSNNGNKSSGVLIMAASSKRRS